MAWLHRVLTLTPKMRISIITTPDGRALGDHIEFFGTVLFAKGPDITLKEIDDYVGSLKADKLKCTVMHGGREELHMFIKQRAETLPQLLITGIEKFIPIGGGYDSIGRGYDDDARVL